MAENVDSLGASREKDPEKSRQLPLLFLSSANPRAPTFKLLEARDQLYPLAAWAFHHADALDPSVRRGLFRALARVWPVPGRPKIRDQAATTILVLIDAGVDLGTIAEQFGYTRKYVSELARQAANSVAGLSDPDRYEYRIDCEPGNPAGRAEPYDPAGVDGLLWIPVSADAQVEAAAADAVRHADAIARRNGYDSFVAMHAARAAERSPKT
jgi:hypothetical protein